MNLLLQDVLIVDKNADYHLQKRDVFIRQGIIQKIGKKLKAPEKTEIVKINDLHISPGWVDMIAFGGEPGFEHKEDFQHLCKSGISGGYTTICCLPNTSPALHSKAEIAFIKNKSDKLPIDILPIGALTLNCAGKNMAEIFDMHQSGAIAFSEGNKHELSAGNLLRSLLYLKTFNGLLIHFPDTPSISADGLMNEGLSSSILGLKGIPNIAEEMEVYRAIQLCAYTSSKLHLAGISTSGSVELIKKAKQQKIALSACVTPYNILLSDTQMENFDANLKLFPPLRNTLDIQALIKGIAQDTIDVISSHHFPQEIECKNVEFDYAEPGMIGLQTAFAAAHTALNTKVSIEKIIEKLSHNPRKILGISPAAIQEGEAADISLFLPHKKWKFETSQILSKSKNTPFINFEFIGKPIGVVKNNFHYFNFSEN